MGKLILAGIPLLFIWILYMRVRKFTRGTGLGWRVGTGKESPERRQARVFRYLMHATAFEREQKNKYTRKAQKTRNPRKKRKYLRRAGGWLESELHSWSMAEKEADPKSKSKGHGIRRAGSERGVHPNKEGRVR